MSKIEMTKASGPLSKYARKARQESVIVVKNGKQLAAVIAIRNADFETVTLSSSRKFLKIIERSRRRRKKEGGLSSRQVCQRLGID